MRIPALTSSRARAPSEAFQDRLRVAFRVHFRVDLEDLPVRPDDARDPLREFGIFRIARPVRDADRAVRIGQERKRKLELLRERGVFLRCVEGDAPDFRVLLLEFRVEVAEPATFDRSTGGIGLRIEPKHDRLSLLVREPHAAPVLNRRLEIRRRISHVQHSSLPFLPDELPESLAHQTKTAHAIRLPGSDRRPSVHGRIDVRKRIRRRVRPPARLVPYVTTAF